MSLPANTVNSRDQTVAQNSQESTSCVEENNKKQHNQESDVLVKKSSEPINKKQIEMILGAILSDNFKTQLKQNLSQCESTLKVLENMYLGVVIQGKVIKELIKLSEEVNNCTDISYLDDCEINITNILTNIEKLMNIKTKLDISKDNAVNDEVVGLEMQINAQKAEEKQNDSTEVTNNKSLNKIRGKGREFTLPPEYDPDDSRWTLRHREKKSGLVELIPHSGVFVDAVKLGHCRRISSDSKVLVRKLLVEVFSDNALNICSITGQKPNAFDVDETNLRPGLDEHGRNVLLNYVEQISIEKNWPKFDKNMVLNSIRNKLQEFRGKYYGVKKPQ